MVSFWAADLERGGHGRIQRKQAGPAPRCALKSFSLSQLEEHLAHCVAEAAQKGGPEAEVKVKEASDAIARLVRS
ncbi:metal-sensing transcriptional repressor [Nonomuraea rubra]